MLDELYFLFRPDLLKLFQRIVKNKITVALFCRGTPRCTPGLAMPKITVILLKTYKQA